VLISTASGQLQSQHDTYNRNEITQDNTKKKREKKNLRTTQKMKKEKLSIKFI
jgi:hypothetical protein